jgi:hypothetical protein
MELEAAGRTNESVSIGFGYRTLRDGNLAVVAWLPDLFEKSIRLERPPRNSGNIRQELRMSLTAYAVKWRESPLSTRPALLAERFNCFGESSD